MINLMPPIEKIKTLTGFITLSNPIKCHFLFEKVNVFTCFEHNVCFTDEAEAQIIFKLNRELSNEAYSIIADEKILIEYSTAKGAFYALQTLKNYIKNNTVPKMEIFDKPKTKVRGFMLDISRNKVWKVKEIKKIIDLMAELKMNHFELYVEGFSFEYKSFSKYLEEDGYISLDEYLEIEKYANDRYIDFVPNQNGFGHMADWLEKDELKDLAVCPDGIDLWGRHREPSTLNPLNDKSLELVRKMYADMIPFTKSDYFNMNFDEPFELGHGLTKDMNREDLYVDFLNKVYLEVKKYNKKPLMWGDVLVRHDDKWDKIPNDMIFIDWGYDANYPFLSHTKRLSEKGISFMCAPGTCSWSSFLGRYIDWYENIKNAVDAVKINHGEGVILTDWGDFGHLQFPAVSIPPIIYMGLYSWSMKEGLILNVRDSLAAFLGDKEKVLADTILDLNNAYRFDTSYAGNGTRSFYRFMWASVAQIDCKKLNISTYDYYVSKIGMNALNKQKYEVYERFFDNKLIDLALIQNSNNESSDIMLICEELKQSIALMKMINHLSVAINDVMSSCEKVEYLAYILQHKKAFLENQEKLWLMRNKKGGLSKSMKCLENFFETVNDIKLLFNSNN